MNWRDHILNNSHGGKTWPSCISPGGRVLYRSLDKYPQLPAPTLLRIDYPYIILDNWMLRFFPLTNVRMDWIGNSTAGWVRQRRGDRKYKKQILQFIDDLERVSLHGI
jgi:hypothetical protein